MALPNGLPQISDLGALLGGLNYDFVNIPKIATPYTNITNRAQIVDLSNDLGLRFGTNRITVPAVYQIPDESGPNGEPVYGSVNDVYDQIRFVGVWTNLVDGAGQRPFTVVNNDYIEVTFYGTGLNVIGRFINAVADLRVTVDNGAESASIIPSPLSTIFDSRNYNPNVTLTAATGLTLGTHTVRIRCVNAATSSIAITAFDILNANASNIKVNTGTAWNDGQKLYLSSQHSSAYNSGFESGTLGSRGGRVVVYLKADGTIGKAVTPTNTSSATLTSTDHTNEEIARVHNVNEFSCGNTTDFSSRNLTLWTTGTNAAFTLDDNTTTLVASGTTRILSATYLNAQNAGDFWTITFVGTGLDMVMQQSGGTNSSSIILDGTSLGAGSANISTFSGDVIKKVASGLPYGTHTVKVLTASATNNLSVRQFHVYQPKTPTIPTGAVEIGSYNIVADYSANTTSGVDFGAVGTIRKMNVREYITGGTLSTLLQASTQLSGYDLSTATNGDYVQYSFFGTGFEFRYAVGAGGADTATVTLDGVTNLTVSNGSFWTGALTTSAYGASSTFTASTGVISAPANSSAYGITVRGLNLGYHTVRVAKTSGAGNWFWQAFDIITPVHSHKDNGPYVLQNALRVSNQSVSDSRKLLKNANTKNQCLAQGVTNGPTGGQNGVVLPLPDTCTTHTNRTGKVRISYTNTYQSAATNAQANHRLYIDGIFVPPESYPQNQGGTGATAVQGFVVPVSPGTHHYSVYWLGNGNTLSAQLTARSISVEEID